MSKTLFICLASYNAPNTYGYDPQALNRQESYAIALNNLLRVAQEDSEIIIVDNTATDLNELKPNLQRELENAKIKDVLLIKNNNLGLKNKGAGEYEMCQAVVKKYAEYIKSFDWVIYYTSRHIIAFPELLFSYLEKYKGKKALVSNVEYLYADGSVSLPSAGQFDDVLFAMAPDAFLGYVNFMDPEKLVARKISSEVNLFKYIQDNQIDYQLINRWGLLRYDYAPNKTEII